MAEWLRGAAEAFERAFINGDRWKLYLDGLGLTIRISLFAAILGLLIGTVLAFMKLSVAGGRKTPWNLVANIYIDVIRGTPAVLQLLIMYFIVFAFSRNGIMIAILTFGINSGAYVAEIVRAGILAVDKGQTEAGRAMGLGKAQTFIHVVMPQAAKNILPPMGNEFIVLLKETAIVGYVGLSDLTRIANQIASRTYEPFMPLIGAAIIYFTIIKVLTVLLGKLERRLRAGDAR